jgi:hypothetical protein
MIGNKAKGKQTTLQIQSGSKADSPIQRRRYTTPQLHGR